MLGTVHSSKFRDANRHTMRNNGAMSVSVHCEQGSGYRHRDLQLCDFATTSFFQLSYGRHELKVSLQ